MSNNSEVEKIVLEETIDPDENLYCEFTRDPSPILISSGVSNTSNEIDENFLPSERIAPQQPVVVLPQAYRVFIHSNSTSDSTNNINQDPDTETEISAAVIINTNNEDSGRNSSYIDAEEQTPKKRFVIVMYVFCLLSTILFFLICVQFFAGFSSNNDNNTLLDTQDEPLETKNVEYNHNESSSSYTNTNSNKNKTSCYTDPYIIHIIEKEAYERGNDPSIPRTYHICANTTMNIFRFTPLYNSVLPSSDNVHPLLLFRPNVHIMCGIDGSFGNNCTFDGGNVQVILHDRSFDTENLINATNVENTTIEGFRFRNASDGTNVAIRSAKSSLTLKNCLFDNNQNMMSSMMINPTYVKSSSVIIQNTSFMNNTYLHNPLKQFIIIKRERLTIPTVGTILVLPPTRPVTSQEEKQKELSKKSSITMEVSISKCVFYNNSFFIDPDYNMTATVINIPYQDVRRLDISNNCFLENNGYSSGLILIEEREGQYHADKNNNAVITNNQNHTQHPTQGKFFRQFGNHFSKNHPKQELKVLPSSLSCILAHQEIDFNAEGFPVHAKPNNECEDYNNKDDQDVGSDNHRCDGLMDF